MFAKLLPWSLFRVLNDFLIDIVRLEFMCVIEGKANTINICHALNFYSVSWITKYVKAIMYFNLTLSVTLWVLICPFFRSSLYFGLLISCTWQDVRHQISARYYARFLEFKHKKSIISTLNILILLTKQENTI